MKVSIVSPVHNEESVVSVFVDELLDACQRIEIDYEIVLVDDGSTDDTWEVIAERTKREPKLRAIRLLRNYGKDAAIFAGLQSIEQSNFVLTLDSDLQHPPSLVKTLLQTIQEGPDIVYAVKTIRTSESVLSRFGAKFLYRTLSLLHKDITPLKTDFMVFTSYTLSLLLSFENRDIPLKGAILSLKLNSKSIGYVPRERFSGSTQWTVTKKLGLAAKLIFSFSAKPITLIFSTALGLLLLSVVFSLQVFSQVLQENALPGFATVILLQLMSLIAILISLMIGFTYTYLSFKSTYLKNTVMVRERISSNQ